MHLRRSQPGVAIALAAVLLTVAGCSGGADVWADRPGPKVLAFFPPIYSLAASVAGDDAQVLPLLTVKGPHDYEPRRSDALKLRRADLFLINGLELDDPLAQKLRDTSGNAALKLVKLGGFVPKESLLEAGACCTHAHEPGHEHHHHGHGAHDPHVWLGIPEAVHMVQGIRDELSSLDPDHAAGYARRAAGLVGRLQTLQEEGKKQLAAKAEKPRMLTHHDSMRYFARSFGAEVVDSIELPGKEPSAKRLAELVEECKAKGVRLIAVEPQYPSHTGAQAVLREPRRHGVEAEFVELDPLETAEPADLTPDYYERAMRANLDRLAGALK
jgi:ABC-type Zn uptake system ZnuABC Zn-binding protein ZnuA